MIVIDATSILWLVAAIFWGWAIGQMIVLAVIQRWDRRIADAVLAWWSRIPFVAALGVRKQREEYKWWRANATAEDLARVEAAREAMSEMSQALGMIMAQMGIAADEAVKAFQPFGDALGDVFRDWNQELGRRWSRLDDPA